MCIFASRYRYLVSSFSCPLGNFLKSCLKPSCYHHGYTYKPHTFVHVLRTHAFWMFLMFFFFKTSLENYQHCRLRRAAITDSCRHLPSTRFTVSAAVFLFSPDTFFQNVSFSLYSSLLPQDFNISIIYIQGDSYGTKLHGYLLLELWYALCIYIFKIAFYLHLFPS